MTLRAPKILVVDGNSADAAAMGKVLGRLRCQVTVAQSGNEALAACLRSEFALIFVDVVLPDMDGYEVAELLKGEESTQNIPIIFVTAADGDPAHRLRGYEIGVIDYVEKPASDTLLLSKAAIFLDLYTSRQQLKLELARSETLRAAARENEARYREALDSAPIPIMLHAEDGEVVLVNRQWLELTGYERAELATFEAWLEKAFGDAGEAVRAGKAGLYGITGTVREGEYPVRTASGAELSWDFRSAPLAPLPDGRRLVVSMAQDVTSHRASLRVAAEAKRMAESADRAKGEFLANMSHEIRTPLHVITGLGHLLRRDLADPDQQKRLDQLCATSEHLLAVISDILDLSKIEAQRLALEYGEFTLGAVVDKVVRIVEGRAQEKGLSLTTDVEPPLRDLALVGDSLRLAQVLINLCGNAVKFTDRGEVRVRIDRVAEHDGRIGLRFSVVDNGIGIAAEDQARLFRAFEQADNSITRERGGTGLGLAISQRLVSLMGGRIQVDSRLGAGSVFSFELTFPRTAARAAAEQAFAAPPAANLNGRRVLFAEDHPLSQEILLEMLEGLGCASDVAADGVEAVACARERRYELILMDMHMPKMDGLTAARIIRTLPGHAATPIVALTANAFVDDRRRCLDAGMNGYICKPVTPATLAAELGRWLPEIAVPPEHARACDNELSRAMARIPGLEVGANWRTSPLGLAAYCEQLSRFVQPDAHEMARLRKHLAAREFDAAHVVAHNLKGIAGLVGAKRVASLAARLAQRLRGGADELNVNSLADECEAELAKLAEAVRALPTLFAESAAT